MLYAQRLKQSIRIVQEVASFGAIEGFSRAFNWGMMALLPIFLASTEEYGRVGLIVSIELLVANISLMGLDRAILRFYGKNETPKKLLKAVLTIWAFFSWLPIAAVAVFYFLGHKSLFSIPLMPHLFLLSCSNAIFNLNVLCICIGRSIASLSIFSKFRMYYTVIKFTSVLLFAKLIAHSGSYVLGSVLSAFFMLIFIIPFLRGKSEAQIDQGMISQLLIFSWPFVFHIISGNILSYFSRFFLEVYTSTKDVGIFTFAFTFGGALYFFYAALSTYFEPKIYNNSQNKKRSELWLSIYANACVAISSFAAASMLFLYFCLSSQLHRDYGEVLPIFSIVIGSILLTPLYLQGNYRLTSHNKTGYIASTSVLSACISVTLNFLLIPRYGIYGAAVALYASNVFLSTSILIISLQIAHVPLFQKSNFLIYIFCIIASLSVLVWSSKLIIGVVMLIVVSVASSVLLLRNPITAIKKFT